MDASAAMRLCEADWFAQHFREEWTVVYTIDEAPARVVAREEYLNAIRDRCVPDVAAALSDGAVKYRNEMQPTQTVVHYEVSPGPTSYVFGVFHFLQLRAEEILSIQFDDVLVRDRNGRIRFFESFVNVTRQQ